MIRNRKYFIPIFIALFCLMYQAMPIHKLFSDNHSISISLVEEDDDANEKEDTSTKKLKSEVDDFITLENCLLAFIPTKANTIYYFHHLPKSYEVKAVFAPPPELV
ncbi:MAG: hypothetical protein RI955_1426 [Bacteroidota bacterium]